MHSSSGAAHHDAGMKQMCPAPRAKYINTNALYFNQYNTLISKKFILREIQNESVDVLTTVCLKRDPLNRSVPQGLITSAASAVFVPPRRATAQTSRQGRSDG